MWQSKEEKLDLLKRLVAIPSISRTAAEKEVPQFLQNECQKLSYFKERPHYLNAKELYFSALVKGKRNETILFISHYDVVGIEDYDSQKDMAFDVDQMTQYYGEKEVREEKQEEWAYGRGTMDMKAGLVVEMGLLEQAAIGSFEGSILLIAVGDEEVGSKGMLAATEEIKRLQEQEGLKIILCVNTEPSFKETPQDENKYLYTGTIGKLLPSFYFKGQETHVGEPFSGLSASFMAAVFTNELEYASDFREEVDGEKTQVLTNLYLRDHKPFYNVQTPGSASCYFNLLFMEQSVEIITKKLRQKTKDTANKILTQYKEKAKKAGITPRPFIIEVKSFAELYQEVASTYGNEKVEQEINECLSLHKDLDEREKSMKIVEQLSTLSESKTPMIVFFYSPPYYPAVSSRKDPLVQRLTKSVQQYAKETFRVPLEKRAFFQGLCDLSYVAAPTETMDLLTDNLPLFSKGYAIPFETIQGFDFPSMNLGPFGADPHQKTERLELHYSFEVLPSLLEHLIVTCFEKDEKRAQ